MLAGVFSRNWESSCSHRPRFGPWFMIRSPKKDDVKVCRTHRFRFQKQNTCVVIELKRTLIKIDGVLYSLFIRWICDLLSPNYRERLKIERGNNCC